MRHSAEQGFRERCKMRMGQTFIGSLFTIFVEMVQLKFAVVVEKDEEGYYVASVPELSGCHTQAKTLDKLMARVKEAIMVYLEAEGYQPKEGVELVGFQIVEVSAK
jgi:predicted RNase H-like HicB family nuclease